MDSKQLKKVLIVEDDEDMREALVDKFSGSGFEVDMAGDGVEGLEKALKDHPDLIILDIIMPRMDGVEVLKKLREDNWGRFVSVIILTNLNDNVKLAQCLEIGVDEYILKSEWKLKDLVVKAKNLVGLV